MTDPKELLSAYKLGFYHRAIFPTAELLLGDFSLGESHTELLKAISPLKASIKRIFPKKDAAKSLEMLDNIYTYFKQLKLGQYKNEKEVRGIFNEIEDLANEVKISAKEYAESTLENRASFLFESGGLLSFWYDILTPPFKLSNNDYEQLCANMNAANLRIPLIKVKELHSQPDDDSWNSHTDIIRIHSEINDQLKIEDISKYLSSDEEEVKLDKLTNLPNLEQFDIDSILLFDNPDLPISLSFVDMDNLKKLNTDIGHDAADEVIEQLAAFIKSNLEYRAKVYHRSGDEFLILFQNTMPDEAEKVLSRLLSKIKVKSFTTSVGDIKITITGGIAAYPENSADMPELKENANKAMQKAKEKGKAQICIFTNEI